jgi:hypothetical protein
VRCQKPEQLSSATWSEGGRKDKAILDTEDGGALSAKVIATGERIALAEIRSVRVKQRGWGALQGFAIGAAAGIGFGAVAGVFLAEATGGEDHTLWMAGEAIAFGGIFGAIGTGLGALLGRCVFYDLDPSAQMPRAFVIPVEGGTVVGFAGRF